MTETNYDDEFADVQHGLPGRPEPEKFDFTETPQQIVDRYCSNMALVNPPEAYRKLVIKQLQDWKLLGDVAPSDIADRAQYSKLVFTAMSESEKNSEEFNKSFKENPWNQDTAMEAAYSEEEIETYLPDALELRKALGENVGAIFHMEPNNQIVEIIVRADGSKQVLNTVPLKRNFTDVERDVAVAPKIIPKTEVHMFGDNQVAVLTQWVEGHMPQDQVEIDLCLKRAQELLVVPRFHYDFLPGNFSVSNEVNPKTGEKDVYWVDRDMMEEIIESGYVEPDEKRKALFEEGKKKLKDSI